MEQHLFVYSRTKYFDYRLIYSPNNQFVPDDIRWKFIDFIREVINEDDPLNGEIALPRWSFYKIGSYILWGIGCRNSFLGSQDSDYTGTKIRGFYGQIIKVSDFNELSLSFNLDYYKELYREKIVPVFETKRESEVNSIDSQWQPNLVLTQVSKGSHLTLNANNKIIRILPYDSNVQEIVESALSFNEANFVCCLNNEGHAQKAESCHFYNVTIIGLNEQKDLLLTQSQERKEERKAKEVPKQKTVKTKPDSVTEKKSMFDRCFEKIAEGILRMSTMFGVSPNEIINRLANKFSTKSYDGETEVTQTEGRKNETDDLQPFVKVKSNREAIRDLTGKYAERKVERVEDTVTDDDVDIRPISFGNQGNQEN